MTYLWDLMNPTDLDQMVKDGYVRVQRHPVYPYNIGCYTKQAMFERAWNDVTMNCRGLIWSQETGEILARPFKKFFNYGEPNAPEYGPDDFVEVWDKMDGSLGIFYTAPDGLNVATKGSFASDQAKWATAYLRAQYGLTEWRPADNHTYLFEIIYPENRIVLDYGATQGLFLLAVIDIESGLTVDVDPYSHPFPTTEFIMEGKYAETYHALSKNGFLRRTNREGVVIRRLKDDQRLKVKQEDYVELHRVMTGLNERQLWEWLAEGKTYDEVMSSIPEELHEWARPILTNLVTKVDDIWDTLEGIYDRKPPYEVGYRKVFAEWASQWTPLYKACLFLLLDNNEKKASELIWKQVKP